MTENKIEMSDEELIGLLNENSVLKRLGASVNFAPSPPTSKLISLFGITMKIHDIELEVCGFTIKKSHEGNLFVAVPTVGAGNGKRGTQTFRLPIKEQWHRFHDEIILKYRQHTGD